MEKEKLFDSLDGLFAYDMGCTDSGISSESLRKDVINHLEQIVGTKEETKLLKEFVEQYFLSEQAIESGSSCEDLKEFLNWYYDGGLWQ